MSLPFLFLSAFVVGLSGAVMPGPVLTATIAHVMKRGFIAGPLIVLGHAILELGVVALAVAGLGAGLNRWPVPGLVGVAGGLMLIVMGAQMAIGARRAAVAATAVPAPGPTGPVLTGPVLAGALLSVSNPYWLIWWLTVGLGYLISARLHGFLGLTAFYVGHISADLAWYSLVASAAALGRRVCPAAVYRWIIIACGLCLLGLGVYFGVGGVVYLAG